MERAVRSMEGIQTVGEGSRGEHKGNREEEGRRKIRMNINFFIFLLLFKNYHNNHENLVCLH